MAAHLLTGEGSGEGGRQTVWAVRQGACCARISSVCTALFSITFLDLRFALPAWMYFSARTALIRASDVRYRKGNHCAPPDATPSLWMWRRVRPQCSSKSLRGEQGASACPHRHGWVRCGSGGHARNHSRSGSWARLPLVLVSHHKSVVGRAFRHSSFVPTRELWRRIPPVRRTSTIGNVPDGPLHAPSYNVGGIARPRAMPTGGRGHRDGGARRHR